MKKNNFWFISLVALFVIAQATSWPRPIKVAVIANSILVLIDTIREGVQLFRE